MLRFARLFAVCLALAWTLPPGMALSSAAKDRKSHTEPPQETGFLNRSIELSGVSYRFQVYLPEDWRRDDRRLWPIVLFLHGRGERGFDGMWQTQFGLPQAVRDHPERWPFVVVMPQCPQDQHWTDPGTQELAMAALDRETAEFHGDPDRTYLTGLSLGGYGASTKLTRRGAFVSFWERGPLGALGPVWARAGCAIASADRRATDEARRFTATVARS